MKKITPSACVEFMKTVEPWVGDALLHQALSGARESVLRPSLDRLDLRILRVFRDFPELNRQLRSETAV